MNIPLIFILIIHMFCFIVLNLSNSEQKAFHCKVVCLIQLSKFEDAMQQIVKFPELSR